LFDLLASEHEEIDEERCIGKKESIARQFARSPRLNPR